MQALERGEADLGVMALDEPQPRLRLTPLMKEPLVLALPEGHPLADEQAVSLRQLSPWPVMVLEKYTALLAELAQAYERHMVGRDLSCPWRTAICTVTMASSFREPAI